MVTKKNDSILEKNKTLAQRFHLEVILEYNLELADEIITADCAIHVGSAEPAELTGPEGAKTMARSDKEQFPKGLELVHDIVLAEGNLVAFHWLFSGTKESGEIVKADGIDIVRIRNDKVAEMWIDFHEVG